MSDLFDPSTGNATLDAVAWASGAATPSLMMEWIILFSIALFFTGLRTYARARISGLRGFQCDDYLVWVALICYAGLTVDVFIITVSARGLANDNISEARRADLARQGVNSLELHLRGLGSKAQLTKWVLYSLVLWLLKSSVLHFFAVRLTDGIRGVKLRTWLSVGLLFITWAGTVVSIFVSCHPFKKLWQIFPNPGAICFPAVSPVLISVFLGCNIITDLFLISLPIPVLVRAPLRKTQKLSLISLFSCNILITGMALTRAILMLKDPQKNGNGMWAVRETFVAIITTNLPPIAPLIRRWLSPCLGRMDTTTSNNTNLGTRGPSRAGSMIKRGLSGASRHKRQDSQALHNQAMADAYFSGFNSQEHLDMVEGKDSISMQTLSWPLKEEEEEGPPPAYKTLQPPGMVYSSQDRLREYTASQRDINTPDGKQGFDDEVVHEVRHIV